MSLRNRDPIERFRGWLRDNAELSDEEEDDLASGVKKLLNDAIRRAGVEEIRLEGAPPPLGSTPGSAPAR